MELPEFKSEKMLLNVNNDVPYLTYKTLEEIPFIRHAFSTKLGGTSKGEFDSMNFALNRGDNPDDVIENYKIFCKATGFDFNTLVASAQDHNTFVRKVTSENYGVGITKPRDIQSVDALVTNEPNVTLVTYYADCTPVFFVDKAKKVIALAHAGWRGTVGKICQNVIEVMVNDYGSKPEDIICCIGPAISKCCYEIDEGCYNQFVMAGSLDIDKIMTNKGNGKYMADLLETNKQIILSCGVPTDNITVSDVCTKCNSDLLWSHRATNGHRGTLCAFMCIKDERI
ncbi:MAG: peptidoglycan editing factor PgeF [Acutalibacteraceae bacterium]|nr:peptidoglycan editing factor PgeF [Acutalibacteraceae bacterium]